MENATSIGGSVVTDCIMAMKARIEIGVMYVYAIGHLGRLYKIQVNNPSVENPVYDTPVLLATLTNGSPTFNYGASIDFYSPAGTERIYIASDGQLTQINFDGSGETEVSVGSGSWVGGVPHPSRQFLGKVFYGNGSNIAQLDSTNTITNTAVLSPGLPYNIQIRDLDVTQDGVYLVIVGTYITLFPILSTSPDINSNVSGYSMIVYWDGTTTAATSSSTIPSYNLTAYHTFANFEYTFGYDTNGAAVMNPLQKALTLNLARSPLPNAVNSNGNMVGWMCTEYVGGYMNASLFLYGQLDIEKLDIENPIIFTRQYRQPSTLSGGDVINVPAMCFTSSYSKLGATSGYTNGLVSLGKMYFSTVEYNGTTTTYGLYALTVYPIGLGTAESGVYETQTQMFGKKVKPTQVRVYSEPWLANQSLKIDLIGSNNSVIPNSSYTFTAASTAPIGQDMLQYNPTTGGTYAIGIRVTNLGTVNPIVHKVELDYNTFGQ
jgi:hypothetical protein